MTAAVSVGSSPPWVDAVISIAPVELVDTKELALMAVHPDGCVTAWSPQDPSFLLMRKRPMKVTCVASAPDAVQHSSLAWFGGANAVECYRARRRDGRYIHLQFLYHLQIDHFTGIRELRTNGNALVAVVGLGMPQVFVWPVVGHVATADNIEEQAGRCVASHIFDRSANLSEPPLGDVSSVLMVENTVWIGCSRGALLLVDLMDTAEDVKLSYTLRTAGSCSVTALALVSQTPRICVVASGMENGDIVLWSAKGAAVLGQYFEHASAVCAMAYVPWGRGLCSVSSTREVILWAWQEALGAFAVVERGVLDDDMGAGMVWDLCAVRDTEVLACAAETSHILHWRSHTKPHIGGGEIVPNSTPAASYDVQAMCVELQQLRAECRRWQELYAASDVERRNAEHNALTSQADADEVRLEMRELKEKFLHTRNDASSDPGTQSEALEKNSQLRILKSQVEAAEEQRNQMLGRVREVEEEAGSARTSYEAEVRTLKDEKWALERCVMVLKSELNEREEWHRAERASRRDKGVNTSGDWWRSQTSHPVLQVEKSTQVFSCSFSPPREVSTGQPSGSTDSFPFLGVQQPLPPPPPPPPRQQQQQQGRPKQNDHRHALQNYGDSAVTSVPLLEAFKEEVTPQLSPVSHRTVNHQVTPHPLSGERGSSLQQPRENMISAFVVEALQAQLSLMETLLRNHREASATPDPLLTHSTNILTDVYLMARDLLGNGVAAAITREALEGRPLFNEREVICKLFAAICQRYRTALLGSPYRVPE
ncbi:hypothetical protein DQ04_01131060 [Trypanosoma grayi]|uniref:hypothetical protein n=1 Tax=Trypanosoma grayi TaxID=71804 RepID=UPI0004F47AF8|nr:hypothetical protein DQ04_01131060 [Trypanosoma grayi]KEG13237.1 hypothetical protein DQ04_01131060 [Trypanosoma grayi]